MKKRELPENYDIMSTYSIKEAVDLLGKLSTSKFVGSVDMDIVLEISDKQKKEAAAGSANLPHTFGEEKKIIAFVEAGDVKTAIDAGAIAAGLEDLVKKVEAGSVEYDVVIAAPTVMGKIAKLGRVLGPKGLMPNPNNGTVTSDPVETIKNFKSGKTNFKKNDQGAIRGRVAKLDMKPEEIEENIKIYLKAVLGATKKFGPQPFKKITLSPTMGKGVRLDLGQVTEAIA